MSAFLFRDGIIAASMSAGASRNRHHPLGRIEPL
jgi:hypothetical protein